MFPTPLLVLVGVGALLVVVIAFVRGGAVSRALAVLAVPVAALLGGLAEGQCERKPMFWSGCEHYTTTGDVLNALALVACPTLLLASLGLSVLRPRRTSEREH